MNQIPAILNTSPPEPKASGPEVTGDMVVESITPSNNYGKEQFEITAKIDTVDQFYSKKYWILQSMPGAKDLQVGQVQHVALRRRRLQQTREGIVKKGYSEEGNLLKHEWDWEILSLINNSSDVEVAVPTAPTTSIPQNNIPKPIASAPPVSAKMSTDLKITRTVAFKKAVDILNKNLEDVKREDLGLLLVMTEEFTKIINNEWE